MDKGCNCASYSCDCYKPNNIPEYKEIIILNNLWQIESAFDSENIKVRKDAKDRLNFVIDILKKRGRKGDNE